MMDFGDVILYTLFPSFMTIQACTITKLAYNTKGYSCSSTVSTYNYLNVGYLSTFSSIQGLDIDFHMVSHTKCMGEVDIVFHTPAFTLRPG